VSDESNGCVLRREALQATRTHKSVEDFPKPEKRLPISHWLLSNLNPIESTF